MSNQESHSVENQDLMAIQIELEEGMSARGVERFWKNLNLAKEGGREDETSYGQKIIAGRMDVLSGAIATWLTEANSGKVGRSSNTTTLLKSPHSDTPAYVALPAHLVFTSRTPTHPLTATNNNCHIHPD